MSGYRNGKHEHDAPEQEVADYANQVIEEHKQQERDVNRVAYWQARAEAAEAEAARLRAALEGVRDLIEHDANGRTSPHVTLACVAAQVVAALEGGD